MDLLDKLNPEQLIYANKVIDAAFKHGVDPEWALATAMAESGFNPNATSKDKKGNPIAYGIMQLKPGTAKDLGANHLDVDQNIDAGVRYMKQMEKQFGDKHLASVAYNAGPNSDFFVSGKVPPESESYVNKITSFGGYKTPEAPATTIAPAEVTDAASLDTTDMMSANALMTGAAGAAAGAFTGPHKTQSEKQLGIQRDARADVRSANAKLKSDYENQVAAAKRQEDQALKLRADSIKAADAAKKVAGQDVDNWLHGQYKGDIASVASRDVLGQPEAAEAAKKGIENIRKAQRVVPGAGPDPTTGLWLPPEVLANRPAAPAPVAPDLAKQYPLPRVQYPAEPTYRPVPPLRPGSMAGRAITSTGGALVGSGSVDAAERFSRDDYAGAGLSALSAAGGAGSYHPNPKVAIGATLLGAGSALVRELLDKQRTQKKSVLEAPSFDQGSQQEYAKGGLTSLPHYAGAKESFVKKVASTVMRPQRMAYPEIYQDPRMLVGEAAARVAPEDPLLKKLFNVNREDLWNISEQGTRKGNITERPFNAAANAKGAAHAGEVMNPRNVQRLQDIIGEAQQRPELYKGMASWYTMDPLYSRFVELYGPEKAAEAYKKFNTLTGMASPGSEVMTELNRGTAANYLSNQGRFEDFKKFGGQAGRGPADMSAVMGHPYHSTAQSGPMEKYLSSGLLDMGSAKVPSYIHASGVPETGFQTSWPVGDAHWSRLVGLPDVRGARTIKGKEAVPNASASVPEMTSLGPWWKDKIAAPMGLEAVPAQAVVWGAGSGATGVTSPIGAGKLELLAKQIGSAAQRMGVSPETARDMIIQGKAYAGGLPTK